MTRYVHLLELARERGCPDEVALDLVQEAHLRFLDYVGTHEVLDPMALLRLIVINLAANYYRRELPRLLLTESIHPLERQGLIVDPGPGPERILQAQQELDLALRQLRPRTRQIFLNQRMGYSYAELAKKYGVAHRTIEKHVSAAIAILTNAPIAPPERKTRGAPWVFPEGYFTVESAGGKHDP